MRSTITTLLFFVILGTTLGFPGKDLSEKEFEDEFHVIYKDKAAEEKAAAELAKEEAEIGTSPKA